MISFRLLESARSERDPAGPACAGSGGEKDAYAVASSAGVTTGGRSGAGSEEPALAGKSLLGLYHQRILLEPGEIFGSFG